MFERRQRVSNGLGFSHVHRSLQRGESIPPLPGLSDQIRACRHELARSRREPPEPLEQQQAQVEEDYLLDD